MLNSVLVKAPRHVFPRILDIDAYIVEPLDFDPFDFEKIVVRPLSRTILSGADRAVLLGSMSTIF